MKTNIIYYYILILILVNKISFSQEQKDCSNNADLFRNINRYTIDSNTSIKEIKLNIIFVQYSKSDPRNFVKTNSEHIKIFNDFIAGMNQSYSNLSNDLCGGNINDSKIRFILNGIYEIQDSIGWNNENFGNSACYSASNGLNYFRNTNIGEGDAVNMFFTESNSWYNEVVLNNGTHLSDYNEECSAAAFPTTSLNSISVVHMRNYFTKYFRMLVQDSALCDQFPNDCCPHCPYSWYISSTQFAHELGHTFGLSHVYTCNNILNDRFNEGNHNFLTLNQLRTIHRNLHVQNIRNYVKDCSYSKKNPFVIFNDENWDFSFKLYEDIIIDSNSTLTIQCELLMPDSAKIEIKAGSTLIIDKDAILRGGCNNYWSGTIDVKPGGRLVINEGASILMEGNGKILIEGEGTNIGSLVYNAGASILLKDTTTSIYFKGGILELGDSAEFKLAEGSGGYARFEYANDDIKNKIISGKDCKITLEGEGVNDKKLEIGGYSLYANDLTMLTIKNCKAEMGEMGRLSVGCPLEFDNVKLTSATGVRNTHRGLRIYGQAGIDIKNSIFEKGECGLDAMQLYWGNPLTLDNCEFNDCKYGLKTTGAGARLSDLTINGCDYGWFNTGNWFDMSFENGDVTNCTKYGIFNYIPQQKTELTITGSIFEENNIGIGQEQGVLTLKCNHIEENTTLQNKIG